MDPNANLFEQRRIVARIQERQSRANDAGELQGNDVSGQLDDGERLAELVEALDGWLSHQGFLPLSWGAGR